MRNMLTVLALCTAFTLSAGNILQNADWQKKSSANLPLQWQLRGSADGVKIEGDSITIGKNDQDIWLIQYLPDQKTLSSAAVSTGLFFPAT